MRPRHRHKHAADARSSTDIVLPSHHEETAHCHVLYSLRPSVDKVAHMSSIVPSIAALQSPALGIVPKHGST